MANGPENSPGRSLFTSSRSVSCLHVVGMNVGMKTQVVWFKRDLRINDHAPLKLASSAGPIVGLYVFEPDVIHQPEHDPSHLRFVLESLKDLRKAIEKRGGVLLFAKGEMPEALDRFRIILPFEALWSHEETGSGTTYARDRRVAAWCRDHGVPWHEFPQTGVIRPLKNRDGWSRLWASRMNEPVKTHPDRIYSPTIPESGKGFFFRDIPVLKDFALGESRKTGAQLGGESLAETMLDSFLSGRSVNYQKGMSSPVTAIESCSRLSTYIAYGNISIRRIHQATKQRVAELKELRANGGELPPTWLVSLSSFAKRLRWHCHFMQKLEDEPEVEFRNMSRACDGMRTESTDEWSATERARFDAWRSGQTGYPMVDACMRCLHETGWINFRMRAMLMSFASYHLWLHWRPTAIELARHFVDFEPGIHFPQSQMQSGTTGINAVRIYSPAKQVVDQDPSGVFIRRWVPELSGVSNSWLSNPQEMSLSNQIRSGCVIGRDYPGPVVEHTEAYALARARVGDVRRMQAARFEAKEIHKRHGSRRSPSRH